MNDKELPRLFKSAFKLYEHLTKSLEYASNLLDDKDYFIVIDNKEDNVPYVCAYLGLVDNVNYEIENGAKNLSSIAMSAAFGGHRDLMFQLINRGVDNINSLAAYAALGGHKELLMELISMGADKIKDYICFALYNGCEELAFELMDRVDNKDKDFYNKLGYFVACYGKKELLSKIIDLGADDFDGFSKHACAKGNGRIIDYLLDSNKVNINDCIRETTKHGHTNETMRLMGRMFSNCFANTEFNNYVDMFSNMSSLYK